MVWRSRRAGSIMRNCSRTTIEMERSVARIAVLVCVMVGGLFAGVWAQQEEPYPLAGKTVAVYFSRKHFTFDDHYRIPLSQFVMSDKGADISIEDLKSQTLISLGALFSSQLAVATRADSVYFLNEYPEQARAFMSAYDADTHSLAPMGTALGQTDYILVVSPFILGSYKTPSVYSRSNRIVTEQVSVKTARVRMEVFEPREGLRLRIAETCMDERNTPVGEILFQFHMQNSQTGTYLSRLFSLAVGYLNAGSGGNCVHE